MGGRRCEPGCACKRHSYTPKKCVPGCTCGHHTAATRQKLSDRAKARQIDEDTRAKISETLRARNAQIPLTERHCEDGCACGIHRGKVFRLEDAYFAKHERVHQARGRAADQTCVECDEPARHWAQLHGTDGTDVMAHYQAMCLKCHYAYDDIYNHPNNLKYYQRNRKEGNTT